jgi:hypothetical protein
VIIDTLKVSMTAFLTGGAFRAALLHLLLSLFLQGQNLWWTQLAAAEPALSPAALALQVGRLILGQWSSVLAALLLGALVAALQRRGAVRSGLLVSATAGILLIADAWSFRVLGDHLGVGFFQVVESPSFLTSSLLAEIGALVPVDLLLLALGVVWQARGQSKPAAAGKRTFIPGSAVVAYLALSSVASVFTSSPELSWHPIANFVRQTVTMRTPDPVAENLAAAARPVSDPLPIDPAEAGRVAAAVAAVARVSQPNIVLLVLESTGARQLLRDGEIDPMVTPNLARLARNGVLFDQVYTNAPSTAQANLAMVTGGRYPTWGSVIDLMHYDYTGDVLGRRLKQRGYRTALFASSDLGYLETRRFFSQAGYDVLSDFGQMPPDRQDELRLNSWGGRDDGRFCCCLAGSRRRKIAALLPPFHDQFTAPPLPDTAGFSPAGGR